MNKFRVTAPATKADRPRSHQFRPHVAFRAALRPIFSRGGSSPSSNSTALPRLATDNSQIFEGRRCLVDLPEGTYLNAALYLDAASLCKVDASCRVARALNESQIGPWRTLGTSTFSGVELERDGVFERSDSEGQRAPLRGSKFSRLDWKGRFWRFKQELPTFRPPFVGQEIQRVRNPDEVAYCRCMLRADVLIKGSNLGVYIEIEVNANPDNLSLAVVDFEAGGHSSVTFSPDTGAVIRERKVREVPRKVEGAYIQPLQATLPGKRFEGSVGLFLYEGNLAFLRRCMNDDKQSLGAWESTGFVTDLSWAEGRCLTPCLAFRDEGAYHVRIIKVGSTPPVPFDLAPKAYTEARWSGLDWEAEPAAEEPEGHADAMPQDPTVNAAVEA